MGNIGLYPLKDDVLGKFSRCIKTEGYTGGIIYSTYEEYNQVMAKFLSRFERIFAEFIENKKIKHLEELKRLSEEFIKFLKDSNYYPEFNSKDVVEKPILRSVKNKVVFDNTDYEKRNKSKFINYLMYHGFNKLGTVNFYYLKDYLNEENPYAYKKALIEELLKEDLDQDVREFFEYCLYLLDIYLSTNDVYAKPFIDRLVRIEIDDLITEEGEDGDLKTGKKVVVKLGYGDTKKTYQEVVESMINNLVKGGENYIGISKNDKDKVRKFEETIESLDNLKSKEGRSPIYYLKKLYEDSGFTKKLRESVYLLLERTQTSCFRKKPESFLTLTGHTYFASKYKLVYLYENKAVFERFKKEFNIHNYGMEYLNTKALLESNDVEIELSEIFPHWSDLMVKGKKDFNNEEGYKVILQMVLLTTFIKALEKLSNIRNYKYMVLVCLDLEDDESYEIWEACRALIDGISHPFQTVKMRKFLTVDNRSKNGVIKNTILSGTKGDKEITIKFKENSILFKGKFKDEFNSTVFVMVENQSVLLEKNYYYYYYRVFELNFSKNNATIKELDDFKPVIFPVQSTSVAELERFIERNSYGNNHVIAICNRLNSPIIEMIDKYKQNEDKNLYYAILKQTKVIYDVRKLTKVANEKNLPLTKIYERTDEAFLIEDEELNKFLQDLEYDVNQLSNYSKFAIKSPIAIPNELRKEPFVSTHLNLFLGMNTKRNKNLYVLSAFLWLLYENESFKFFYSKPKFIPKKLPKVSIQRKSEYKQITYKVHLSHIIYELIYYYNRWKNTIR